CECVDFRSNGLGTCKHVEAVLMHLEGRFKRLFRAAAGNGSGRLDGLPEAGRDTLRLSNGHRATPSSVQAWFDPEGVLIEGTPETALGELKRLAAGKTQDLRGDRPAGFAQEVRKR